MKKNRSFSELKEERKRITDRQHVLENSIREGWTSLKSDLRPSSLVDRLMKDDQLDKHHNGAQEHILKSTFVFGVTLLAKKLADKASDKFASWWQRN